MASDERTQDPGLGGEDCPACQALARYDEDGRHWHACPVCYEDEECFMDCTIEHDLSGPRAMGSHAKCSKCEGRMDYPFTLGGNV